MMRDGVFIEQMYERNAKKRKEIRKKPSARNENAMQNEKKLLLSSCNFKCSQAQAFCNAFSGKFKWQINPRNQAAHSLSNKNISSHFESRGSALHTFSLPFFLSCISFIFHFVHWQNTTISFICSQRFSTLSMSLLSVLHIELRQKTKNRRQKWPCIFRIHSDCNKENKFVCMYDVYVLDYIACFTRMAAMERQNGWQTYPKSNSKE